MRDIEMYDVDRRMDWDEAEAQAWMDERFWKRAVAESHWCLWPRLNYKTNRLIWLKPAVKMTQTITGPGEPAIITRYYTPEDYTLEMLRR